MSVIAIIGIFFWCTAAVLYGLMQFVYGHLDSWLHWFRSMVVGAVFVVLAASAALIISVLVLAPIIELFVPGYFGTLFSAR